MQTGSEGREGGRLGVVIGPKRIYNFLLFHAIFMLLTLVFILSLLFICTNLLIVAKVHNVLVLHFDV